MCCCHYRNAANDAGGRSAATTMAAIGIEDAARSIRLRARQRSAGALNLLSQSWLVSRARLGTERGQLTASAYARSQMFHIATPTRRALACRGNRRVHDRDHRRQRSMPRSCIFQGRA